METSICCLQLTSHKNRLLSISRQARAKTDGVRNWDECEIRNRCKFCVTTKDSVQNANFKWIHLKCSISSRQVNAWTAFESHYIYWLLKNEKEPSFKLQHIFVCSRVWSDNRISRHNNRSPSNIVKVVFTKMETCFANDRTARVRGVRRRGLPLPPHYPFSHKEFPMHQRRVQWDAR